jgi:hypothetical protein
LGALAAGKSNVDFAVPELRQGDRVVAAMLQNIDVNISIAEASILTDAAFDSTGGQVRIQFNNSNAGAVALAVDPQDIVLLVARVGGEGGGTS